MTQPQMTQPEKDQQQANGLGAPQPRSAPVEESAALARGLVRALVVQGLREVIYCPGSRDAPFAYALDAAEQAGWISVQVCLDERDAAFRALGLAKAAAALDEPRPVAVITTSGTAVANLHPALLEADAAGIALLAITADRPHEMWRTGANQTTEQLGLFGSAVRFEADVPAGYPTDGRLTGLLRRVVMAANGVLTANPGPAHLNVCFHEPLRPADQWQSGERPDVERHPAIERPAHRLELPAHTVVVAGDSAGAQAMDAAQEGGWPLLAEPSSGARGGSNALTDYQSLLGGPLADEIEAVLVFGHPTLSRPISALLARDDVRVVAVSAGARWTDVAGVAEVVPAPVSVGQSGTGAWLAAWHEADDALRAGEAEPSTKDTAARVIWQAHCDPHQPGDRQISRDVQQSGHDRTSGNDDAPGLVIGASAVIRSFDRHALPGENPPLVVANRGLGGIDGTLATAVGMAAGLHRPVRAVVGDLTMAHNGLGLLHGAVESVPDVQVVVLADHGGAIFAGLEHGSADPALLSRYFLTPQTLELAHVAAAVGADYQRVDEVLELPEVLSRPIRGLSIIEVVLPALG